MLILGLDLGTSYGWCLYDTVDKTVRRCGTGVLSTQLYHDSVLSRCIALRLALQQQHMACDLIAYESVHAHTGINAAHLYAALRTTVQMHAYANDIQFRPISVQAGKAALTGRANASKELSVHAALVKFKITCTNHDQADAIGVALAAAVNL